MMHREKIMTITKEHLSEVAGHVYSHYLIIGETTDDIEITTSMGPVELLFHLQMLQYCILSDNLELKERQALLVQ